MPERSKSRSRSSPAPSAPTERGEARGPAGGPPAPRVDVHLHLSRYWPDLATNSYAPTIDFTVPGLLRELDQQRVGCGVLLLPNESPSVEETLREGEEIFEASGGRLLRTSTVDPTGPEGSVRHAIELWERTSGLVALKLYPGYQHFYPSDPRLDPLYEFAARRRLVVMIHQGDTLDPRGLVKFSRPIEVDEVAVRYRDLSLVLCHLGNPWVEEAAELVYKNPNVYTDTSGVLWHPRLPHFDRMVRRARQRLSDAIAEMGDVSRILYGSDWPLESIEVAVDLVEKLELPEKDRAAILGGNARRLFRLDT